MDNKYTMLNEIFNEMKKFDEIKFNKFIINLLNLESKDRINSVAKKENEGIYENYIDYVKDIGKYRDENRKIILASIVKLKYSPDKARTMQRNFIAKHLKDTGADAAVVALYSENTDIWRISFVKLDYTFDVNKITGNLQTTETITPAKRYSYLIEPKLKNHTVQEQLRNLLFDDSKKPSVEDIENVFSVEVVTDEFFKMYKEKYLDLKEFLETNNEFIEEANRLMVEVNEFSEEFAKKLMGQVSFLYFLQKKGWLGVPIVPFGLVDRNEFNLLKSKENEDVKEIMDKVFNPSNADKSKMELDRKALNDLSNTEADWLSNVFKGNPKYDKQWGDGTKVFIRGLFNSYSKNNHEGNFFNSYLEPLFYEALNERRGPNEYYKRFNCKIPFLNGGLFEPIYKYEWKKTNIEIPDEFFSNDENTGLLDFFDMYNFTMNEDEPLEKEVAVDPEMLGKIFENLLDVKERKSKGAFYTPREIVHYMCQECLINYLNKETNIDTTSLEVLIKYGEVIKDVDLNIRDKKDYKMPKFIIDNLEIIDKALENVTVADPSVGSGAFPLGMLNEIVKARSIIVEYMTKDLDKWEKEDFIRNNKKSIYDLKKNAMKRSIFAVDIEPSAVDITKLRLWLSLVVDADIRTINTLPNLDYNIMVGNSLIEEFNGIKLFDEELLKERPKRKKKEISNQISMNIQGSEANIGIEQEYQLLEDIQRLQSELFDTKENSEKVRIKKQAEDKEWDLIEYKLTREQSLSFKEREELKKQRKSNRRPYFLWKLEFSKIFKEKGGFDIVIGNPPYIKVQNIGQNEIEILKKAYKSATGKFDIYVLFIEKGFDLINNKGIISYIHPHRFMIVDYGKGIRKFIQDVSGLNKFINFGVNQVFDTATTYTGIYFYNRDNIDVYYANAEIKNLNLLKFDKKKHNKLEGNWIFKPELEENIIENIKNQNIKMLDIFEKIYQGAITPGDDIFILTGNIEGEYFKGYSKALDRNVIIEKDIMKMLLKGENIRRYKKVKSNYYLFYPHEINEKRKTKPIEEIELMESYPLAYEYISNFKEYLIEKKIKYKTNPSYWYSLHRAREKYIFESDKIITPQLQNYPNFTLDTKKFYPDAGGYLLIKKKTINEDLYYLLGILNSSVMWFFIKNTSTAFNNNYYYFKSAYLEPFSFPKNVDLNIKNKIISLVEDVIGYYNENNIDENKIKNIENQINYNVYKVYNFTDEQIEIIEKYNVKG